MANFEVGSVFSIVDRASPVIAQLSRQMGDFARPGPWRNGIATGSAVGPGDDTPVWAGGGVLHLAIWPFTYGI
jgi:hypothetical protein